MSNTHPLNAIVFVISWALLALVTASAAAQTQTYRSDGGLEGQFQQLSPRTPAFSITARGTFEFDAAAFSNSNFQFVLAGAGLHRDLGDLVQIKSQRFIGNQNGALVFQVAFLGANGGNANLPPVQARLVLEQPNSLPAGRAPAQMQLRLLATTNSVRFDLPILLRR